MRLTVTVNLGGYESIRIETSEYPNLKLCLFELDKALTAIGSNQAIKFRDNYVRPALRKIKEVSEGGKKES